MATSASPAASEMTSDVAEEAVMEETQAASPQAAKVAGEDADADADADSSVSSAGKRVHDEMLSPNKSVDVSALDDENNNSLTASDCKGSSKRRRSAGRSSGRVLGDLDANQSLEEQPVAAAADLDVTARPLMDLNETQDEDAAPECSQQ